MKKNLVKNLSQLKEDQALSLLDYFARVQGARSVAFFKTAVAEADHSQKGSGHTGFIPHLSILGINAGLVMQSRNGEIKIEDVRENPSTNAIRMRKGNPFLVFSELLNERRLEMTESLSQTSTQTSVTGLPFFQGGALGYFGYDAVRFIEPSLQQTRNLGVKNEVYDSEIVFLKII